jgi:TATA-box binding protein (TBP) (component of TFIID and TFIIIB)
MELSNGIIKKQIKVQTNSNDDFIKLTENKKKYSEYILTENILYDSTTVTARQDKFKDIRKISIGLSKKDITTYRSKEKSAFYNCFVLIVRTLFEDEYKEVHVKIFNTGKMEIPGVHNDVLFENVKREIIRVLQPYFTDEIYFNDELCITVLINSNFNAGFSIKRCQLYNILRMKYNISACYDPCSYPGVQCKYNFEEDNTTISFMIFRTGSVLIVGKCSDKQLYIVYDFLVRVFNDEYESIKDNYILPIKDTNKKKKKKKRTIIITK